MKMNEKTKPKLDSQAAPVGRYAAVNGIELYYEIQGAGEPLILLHGGVGAGEMFAGIIPQLAEHRRVINVHLQAHGRTPDVDRPLRFELMAEDIAGLLGHLGLQTADLLGYSLGGGVALRTAIQHPEAVSRLILISTPCKHDGWYPEVLAGFEQMSPQFGAGMQSSPLAEIYPDVDWAGLFGKLHEGLVRDYDWSAELGAIRASPLLIYADADAIRPAHIVEFFGLFGGGQRDAGLDGSGRPAAQLAILPGCTHYNLLGSPALPAVLLPYLAAPASTGTRTR